MCGKQRIHPLLSYCQKSFHLTSPSESAAREKRGMQGSLLNVGMYQCFFHKGQDTFCSLLCAGLQPTLEAKQPGQLLSCNKQLRVKNEADFVPAGVPYFLIGQLQVKYALPFAPLQLLNDTGIGLILNKILLFTNYSNMDLTAKKLSYDDYLCSRLNVHYVHQLHNSTVLSCTCCANLSFTVDSTPLS